MKYQIKLSESKKTIPYRVDDEIKEIVTSEAEKREIVDLLKIRRSMGKIDMNRSFEIQEVILDTEEAEKIVILNDKDIKNIKEAFENTPKQNYLMEIHIELMKQIKNPTEYKKEKKPKKD